MTECKTEPYKFHALGSREVVGHFEGGDITTDAGGLLLREAEKRTGIVGKFAACFTDYRDVRFIEHPVADFVTQGVHVMCLGYEDLTDPIHGHQEGRFFHGYYDCYCYLPLYIFCGEFLLSAQLRSADIDPAKGALTDLKRVVAQIRRMWPRVHILVRGDSGFCRDAIMDWCERQGIDYVFGLAKNPRLLKEIGEELKAAETESVRTGTMARIFKNLRYRTLEDTWSRTRRVVAKAEHLNKGSNPRFVVTSLAPRLFPAAVLYETIYCARGEMENRIKEQQLGMFADRTSTATMRGNQLRLYFSSIAYILMHDLRRLALKGTDLERAQCTTIRLKLLKIGAQIHVTVRRVWIRMAACYRYKEAFQQAFDNLQQIPLRC